MSPETPHFDAYQFDGRRANAVSQDTCLSFQDYGSMHIERRGKTTHRRKPEKIEWVFDDGRMRNVILTSLERRYYIPRVPGTPDADRLERINEAAKFQSKRWQTILDARLDACKEAQDTGAPAKRIRELEIVLQNIDSRLQFDRQPAVLLTAIVYMSYRQGWNSTTVAEELHILPPHVRITLYRLNKVAADLKAGRPYRLRTVWESRRPWSKPELVLLWILRAHGLSWKKCAKKLGRLNSRRCNGSNLILVWKRHFETRIDRRWTGEKLLGLWILRHTAGYTWPKIAKAFGVTPAAAYTCYRNHFVKPA